MHLLIMLKNICNVCDVFLTICVECRPSSHMPSVKKISIKDYASFFRFTFSAPQVGQVHMLQLQM